MADKFQKVDEHAIKSAVMSKLNTLKNNFRRNLRKVNESIKSGKGADDDYKPCLTYFDLIKKHQKMLTIHEKLQALGTS